MRIPVTARPRDFALHPGPAALLIIDMQRDFIEPRGFGSALGNDVGQRLARGAPGCDIVPELANLVAITQTLEACAP